MRRPVLPQAVDPCDSFTDAAGGGGMGASQVRGQGSLIRVAWVASATRRDELACSPVSSRFPHGQAPSRSTGPALAHATQNRLSMPPKTDYPCHPKPIVHAALLRIRLAAGE